jgi:hypothetical protein
VWKILTVVALLKPKGQLRAGNQRLTSAFGAIAAEARDAEQTVPLTGVRWPLVRLALVVSLLLGIATGAKAGTHYVDGKSVSPVPPYNTWATAATDIQDAVDVASLNDEIIVTNGTYLTGGRAVSGTVTNRVAVDRPVFVRSVNGPQFTVIQGYQVPGSVTGDGAIRCVYLTNGATLTGFTLTNGATGSWDPPLFEASSGGGARCETGAVLSNCTIVSNSAAYYGGGVRGGTLNNCIIAGNTSSYGGGAYEGTFNNCVIRNNTASDGGGAYVGQALTTLNNCLILSNYSGIGGGVSGFGTIGGSGSLSNCTIVGNVASEVGGGIWMTNGTLVNCIIYYNAAPYSSNWAGSCLDFEGFCCTTPPLYCGTGNITNEPLFVDLAGANLRLLTNSPCIDAGNNAYVSSNTDLDGRPRVVGSAVDIGAYEFQPGASGAFIGWLQQYGLATDGSADYADSDGDGMNNWQEWRASTNPTNAESALRMLLPAPAGTNVKISWQSVAGVTYFLERSTNLDGSPAFLVLATNLPGESSTTAFTDANISGAPRLIYRVGVQ